MPSASFIETPTPTIVVVVAVVVTIYRQFFLYYNQVNQEGSRTQVWYQEDHTAGSKYNEATWHNNQNQIWCVNIGGYMPFGSIVGSDYWHQGHVPRQRYKHFLAATVLTGKAGCISDRWGRRLN